MPPARKTLLLLLILLIEIGFIIWTRLQYSHQFLDFLQLP